MAALDTDEVAVLVADLRLFARAINSAYGSQAAWDLLNQYRGLESAPKESNLSKALKHAHKRVLGYIAEAENDDEPIEDIEVPG
jgi:hypothetical protein